MALARSVANPLASAFIGLLVAGLFARFLAFAIPAWIVLQLLIAFTDWLVSRG